FFQTAQDATEKRGELAAVGAGFRLLEEMIVAAVQQPDFVGNAGSGGAKSGVVALNVHGAFAFLFFLANDVAKNAALFFLEPLASGAQLILDAARNEDGAGDFRMRVRPLFAGQFTLVFEDADVLEANVLLEVGHARHPDGEDAVDVSVAELGKALVVVGCFDDSLVGPGGAHAVVHAVGLAAGFALDAVERFGMRHNADLPRPFTRAGKDGLLLVDGRSFER